MAGNPRRRSNLLICASVDNKNMKRIVLFIMPFVLFAVVYFAKYLDGFLFYTITISCMIINVVVATKLFK